MNSIDFSSVAFLLVLLFLVSVDRLTAHTPTPLPSAQSSPTASGNIVPETNAELTPMRHATDDFPNYHPLVVHFPIVLLIVAALFQMLSFFTYRKEFSAATVLFLFVGTISVWLASNIFHAHPAGLPEDIRVLYEEHELMAKYTWWLALAALASKGVSHFFLNRKWWSEAVVLALLVGASITVSIAGHHGAQLVHIKGVGPQGQYLEMEGH